MDLARHEAEASELERRAEASKSKARDRQARLIEALRDARDAEDALRLAKETLKADKSGLKTEVAARPWDFRVD